MNTKRKRHWTGDKRFRLLLTLELAVMLPAAALIYYNFHHVKSIKRDKNVEATIHREFQYLLAAAEKDIDDKIYTMVEETKNSFPSLDTNADERAAKLDQILRNSPFLSHIFLFDADNGVVARSQPHRLIDKQVREERDRMADMFAGWFTLEGKMLCETIRKKTRPVNYYPDQVKRDGVDTFVMSALFTLPDAPKEKIALGVASFDPDFLKQTFFPNVLEEMVSQKPTDESGHQLALAVFPTEHEGQYTENMIASSSGWAEGKPEVLRNLDDVFRGLTMGVKFQGTSADAIASRWMRQSILILGVLSVLMIGGLVLTDRSVSKEIALAKLKSDFVSNVSHELRTPLSLILLYAETLELGRIKTQEKKDEYYRIMRKESERLGKLINNILDFSRIEAGRKEYDLRETDIAELVRNTLDSYRYQIEKNGFEFEMSIDPNIPAMRLDREAIARALLNLVNNALKYSADQKFLVVRLYRTNGTVKLEVADHGIGIARREQEKIFEKFYRTCDPLVHNTKGSGLGLSLVKHITHAHGGQVEVESAPGRGSKFTLSLPLVSAAAAAAADDLTSKAAAT